MAGNTLGTFLRLTTFGESHGSSLGGILDGFPAGVELPLDDVRRQLARRRPGQSALTTPREEKDAFELLSGHLNGRSTGTPIGWVIPNMNTQSQDYEPLKEVYRPGHADEVYAHKFGIRDHRGGGRSSARETANWVLAGTLASALLPDTTVTAWVSSVGQVQMEESSLEFNAQQVDQSPVRCPDPTASLAMEKAILAAKEEGDSLGGIITAVATGIPVGLGEPVFQKLHAALGHALFSLNAVKGVEFGWGFEAARRKGSEVNVLTQPGVASPEGGITGGLSNGSPLVVRVAFKPVASIAKERMARNAQGQEEVLSVAGRHDPCVVPRAVPIVEALVSFVLADAFLQNKARTL